MSLQEIKSELKKAIDNKTSELWVKNFPDSQIKVVVFDFDGVIFKENGIHESGYAWIIQSLIKGEFDFNTFPEEKMIEEATMVRKQIKGLSPNDKLKYLVEKYSANGLNGITYDEINKNWMLFLRQSILNLYSENRNDFILDGGAELVRECSKNAKIFGLTANYQEQAEWLMNFVGLSDDFDGIIGYPIKNNNGLSKDILLKQLIETNQFDKNEVCFIGDGRPDVRAGNTNGVYSVGVANTVDNGMLLLEEDPDCLLSAPSAYENLACILFNG